MKKSELRQLIKEEILKEYDPIVLKKTTDEINKKLKSLGISATYYGKPESKLKMILKAKIDPKRLGMFSPVFEEIELEVYAAISDVNPEVGVIKLLYAWKHPSGSNGYTIVYRLDNNKWEEK